MLAMKNYRLGLSWVGVLAVALVMLPNAAYLFLAPPRDVLAGNAAGHWLWNAIENIGRFGVMATLCAVRNSAAPRRSRGVDVAAACALLAYGALWVAYFAGAFSGLSLVGMAILPSAFFLLIAWRQRNLFALCFGALFAVAHVSITAVNFLL